MAKQLNVSLAFQADTSQAKAQIQGLVNELNKLSSIGAQSVGTEKLTSEIVEAKMAAKDLGAMLEQSFNVDTGKLDLNKFNSSLKKSGLSLTDYGNKMAALGNQGDQAFLKIAQSIVETEAPLRRSSGLLKEFGTTLANTARWQISSSILHGFMGSVQKAYGYAQDLNESLNNIRIVTGQNIDQMTVFAERANKAAKALSTTTTDYTNASLIYYQQGLNDQEVQERTDITVKMANVAGQSAETVSDQLTAVWNNFDDGTKSLEHYADVMTALGAATASSTDEIADGLEKFAAVADTVGLSYEYAASALATVTATTRQSADVVGTAFKTLFARIEGLELGETLEDGTTLNKYSEALMAVGVNIKDSNGEMKEMDTILDEMAAKWDTLNKDQQIALAQTVAGVRQYTQLIALMDNWDFMEENLATSANSTGALDEQQKIYEESWAASQDRVKASMEGVFDSLINEDFFIGLNDTLSSILGVVEKLIDALGGMPGILSIVGVLITSIFKDELSNGINNALHNFKNFTGASKEELKRLKKEAYEYARSMTEGLADTPGSEAMDAQRRHLERTYEMQKQLEVAIVGTNSAQEKAAREAFKTAENYSKAAVEAAKYAEEVEKAAQAERKKSSDKRGGNFQRKLDGLIANATGAAGENLVDQANYIADQASSVGAVGATSAINQLKADIQAYNEALSNGASEAELTKLSNAIIDSMTKVGEKIKETTTLWDTYDAEVREATEQVVGFEGQIGDLQESAKNFNILDPQDGQSLETFEKQLEEIIETSGKLGFATEPYQQALEALKNVAGAENQEQAWSDVVEIFNKLGISADAAQEKIKEIAEESTIDKVTGTKKEDAKQGGGKDKRREVKDKRSKAGAGLKKEAEATEELTKKIYGEIKAKEKSKKIDEEAKKKKEALAAALEKAKKSTQDFGQGVTKMMNGVSSLSMGLTSLSSAWDALQDPDMSAWDKFTSIMMSMSMGLPSLIAGFKGLGSGIKEMTGALGGSTMALLANALGLDAEALAQDEANDEKIEGMILDKEGQKVRAQLLLSAIKAVASSTLEKEAQEELNEEKGKESILTLGNIAMKKMEQMASAGGTASKIAETGATIGATLAQHGFNAALAPFIGLMLAALAAALPYIAALAALAAVVGLVVYAATAESRALEAAKNKYDESAQAAERATEQYQKLTEEAEKFKEAISGYDEALKGLDELEKGTKEYEEALKAANKQAKEIIETYGLWKQGAKEGEGDWYYDENGVIQFNDDVISGIQADKDAAAASAETDMYAKKIIANEDKVDYEKLRTRNSVGADVEYTATGYDEYGNAYQYQAKRQFSDVETDQIVEAFGKLENAASLDAIALEEALKQTGNFSGDLANNIKAIVENRDAFQALTKTVNEANEANKAYEKELVGNLVEEEHGDTMREMATYTDSEGKEQVDEEKYNKIKNAAAERFAAANEANDASLSKELSAIDVSDVKSTSDLQKYDAYKNVNNDEDLARKYAEVVLGKTAEEVANLDYKAGTGKGTLKDASGNTVMDGVSDEYMRQQLAKQAEIDAIKENYKNKDVTVNGVTEDEYMASLGNLANQTGQTTEYGDMAGALLSSLQNGTEEIDLSSIFGNISAGEKEELQNMSSEELLEKLGLSAKDLSNLGLGSAEEFTKKFQDGLADWTPEKEMEGIAKELGMSTEAFDAYVDNLMKNNEALKDNKDLAKEVAKQQIKFERQIKNISKVLKDNEDALDKSQEGTEEYYEACGDLATELNKLFGDNAFDTETVSENLDDVKKALDGDAEAYDRLQQVAATNLLKEQLDTIPQTLQDTVNAIAAIEGIDVGELITIDESGLDVNSVAYQLTDMYNQAYQAAIAGGQSTAEAMEYANQLMEAVGFNAPEMIEKEVILTGDIPDGWTPQPDGSVVTTDASGNTVTVEGVKATKTEGGTYTYTQTMLVPKEKGTGFTKMSETIKPSGGSKSGGGGGGGGSKPKKTSEARGKKSDIVDRYKEINDQLEETTRLMDKNSILAEGLWGPARFKKLKENIKLMEQENKQLKEKYELSKLYLEEDANALLQAGQEAGISFNIDSETGLITNYTDVMTQLYNEREALLNSFGETMDEAEEERLAEFDKKVDAIKESYEQYETTLDEKKDAEEEHLQKVLDIQTAYYDLLNEELEVNLSVNEKDLEILEYYLNKFSDDFYHMAEAATLMVGDFANGKIGGQIADYFSNIDMYRNNMDQMEKDHSTINPETGATYINDQQYVTALGDTMSNVLGELSNIINIDKQMLTYYADALAAAGEEVAKYTDRMEHLNGVLDHYKNIMSLMGKEKDYKKMGTIIAGQVKVAEDQMNAAKATYEMYVDQQKDIYDKWQAAIASGDTAAAELFEKEYYAITETVEEAQNNFLSSTEATLEAYKAELENDLAEIGELLEDSLTGGKGFDWINSTMERMNSLHEEYLTTTNKIYETNKMMNQTQQEIDKTSNTVAKRKLKDFISQTKSLQEQTALSKFELDIQKAKYDLLLAEIALEEAQNAKSQVRLQRDSEGNFGYVYTADTSAVDDAQQKYEDAQNNLYNVSLEGANKYAEQRNQLTQEFYDTMRELEQQWLEGSFASEEEYRTAQEEAQTYYYEKLRQASELYNVAIGADTDASAEHILGNQNLVYNESFTSFAGIAEKWKNINLSMQSNTNTWKEAVSNYVDKVIAKFNQWDTRCAEIEKKTHLDNLAGEVENITKKSSELVTELTKEGGVIDSVEEQLDKVQKVTEAYALQRKEIQGLIEDLEKYIKTLQDKYNAETQSEEEEEPEDTNNDTPEDTGGDTGDSAAATLATEAKDLVTKVHYGTIRGKNGEGWIPAARRAGYSENAISLALKAINDSKSGAGYDYYYEKALSLISSYDTGGYTGEWNGQYGKLAMLHQKELILNEKDTENFLMSLEVMEKIIKMIDLQSANAQYLGNLNSPTFGRLKEEQLEQNVHIEANFPNVVDRNQIEEAFRDIVNMASQYANRK